MRVLLVDLETEWRGGQNQALLLLKGLRARGHEAELVAATGSSLGVRAAAAGVAVHSVSRGGFRVAAAWKIRGLLRDGPFDVVHANEAHAVTAVWLGQRGAHATRVPFVISRRVGYPIGKSAIARVRYHSACRIVANSKWVAEQAGASGAPREKLAVIYEGVEIPARFTLEQREMARARWGISPQTPLLGCVGVLLPDKGQEWLIRALPLVRAKFPGAKLLLAGEGPGRSKLESLACELGIEADVIFAGFVADVASIYAALDVFLLPSFFEALNNSLLAAMAYEIASIAFDRGALAEIIEHGESGLLVSGPEIEEISAAVVRILGDAALATRLAAKGRERVEKNFSADAMVEGMIRVYEDCIASGRGQ